MDAQETLTRAPPQNPVVAVDDNVISVTPTSKIRTRYSHDSYRVLIINCRGQLF